MMKFKRLIFFSLMLFILSITAVSAADLNDTDVDEPLIVNEENYLEIDGNSSSQIQDNNELLGSDPSPGTFDDLQREINAAPKGSTLDLYRDYRGHYGSRIQFNKDLTIDGHGHTLDGLNEGGCSAFYSSSGSITLKNLVICNCNNDYTKNGGAISITGSASYNILNCTFRDNKAAKNGGAIYNEVQHSSLSIRNCTFINNKAEDGNGGAIYGIGDVHLDDSYFASNYAKENGGVVYALGSEKTGLSTTWAYGSTFEKNSAGNDGGAIYEDVYLRIYNSTFKSNTAEHDGGAAKARSAWVNENTYASEPISFFINNVAKGDDGGAIRVAGDVDTYSAYYYGNKANTDGGAITTGYHCNVYNCVFDSNRAEGASVLRCFGGAIKSWQETNVYNSRFVNNYAENSGGAIHAKTASLWGPVSYFENNEAYKSQGGAIYTESFKENINSGIFIGNKAGIGSRISDDGGAIYISDEKMDVLTISGCVFLNNHCTDEGGAIYVDTASDHIILRYNIFYGNKADDKGQSVYNCGYYDAVEYNWQGSNNPSFSDQFKEYHRIGSDTDYSVSKYAKLGIKINETEIYEYNPYAASVYFTDNSNKALSGKIPLYGLELTGYGANYSNFKEGNNEATFDVVFTEDDGKLKAKLNSQELYLSPSDIKNKTVSSVQIVGCDDVIYPRSLIVYLDIQGRTNPFYVITDDNGSVVRQENFTGYSFSVKDLEPGYYSLLVVNPETWTCLPSNATARFTVWDEVKAKIYADNVTYGEPTTFNMTSNIDGIFNIDVAGHDRFQIEVINGTGTKKVGFHAGEYQTRTTPECGYYILKCQEASFDVDRYKIDLYLDDLDDVVYPNNITGSIFTSLMGNYELTIGTRTVPIFIYDEFVFNESGFDAGTYNVIVTGLFDDDYYPAVATGVVNVLKQNVSLSIFVHEGKYGDPVIVMARVSCDGEYTVRIGELEKTVNITDKFGLVDFGVLDAGSYNASIEYAGDRNHNPASNTTAFEVYKSDTPFELYTSGDKFVYGDEIEIKHTLPESATGYILYSLADGTLIGNLSVGKSLRISTLDAGENYINGRYSGDSNFNFSSDLLKLTVDKAPNNVVVDVKNVTYGESSAINVAADVDGDYAIRINGTKIVVHVKDGIGKSSVDLNAGEYATSTTFDNDNYDSKITESTFKVEKAVNNVEINVEDVVYGESSVINVIADVDGNYTVNVNGRKVNVNVAGGKGNTSISLDANNYTTSTTFDDDNYDTVVSEAEFEVKKARNNVFVLAADVVYGNPSSINIIAEADGDYTVDVGGKSLVITVKKGYGKNSVSLDAGSYPTQTTFSNPNYSTEFFGATVNVLKADISLNIAVLDCTYPSEVNGTVFANVDGDYTVTIGNYTAIVAVKNSIGVFNAGILDAGIYNATVSFKGDANHNGNVNMTTFEVEKQKITFNITANDTDIHYGESVKITPTFEEDVSGSIRYSLGNGTFLAECPVNESMILPQLDAGSYLIMADYGGDKDHESAISRVLIRIKQAPNKVYVSVDNVTYGTPSVVNIAADADGNYTVDINGDVISVNVLNGKGSASVLLEAGSYSTVTDFENRNYDTRTSEADFEVRKADIALSVVIDDKVYSEDVNGTVYAGVDGKYALSVGNYKADVIVENGVGEFNIGILDAGSYDATISYAGDNNHNPASNTTEFTVDKADTVLHVFVLDTVYPNEVYGIILTNCNSDIELYLNGTFFDYIPVEYGFEIFSLGKLDVGRYNVSVKFDGNKNFNPASNNCTFNVTEGNLTFVIGTNASSFNYGDSIVINHTINDDATGTIRYYLSNGTFLGDADVSENFTLPVLDAGRYLIIANYGGDHNYPSAASVLNITIANAIDNVVVSVGDVTYGNPSVINVVADVDGVYTVRINGKKVTVNVLNGVGNNSITLDAGSYSTNTSCALDNYDLKVTEADFEVKKAETLLNISVEDVIYSENVEGVVYASVDGRYGVTVGNASVTVNVRNGVGKFSLGVLDAGAYNATVTFGGTKNYKNNTNATMFTVEKADVALVIFVDNQTYPDDVEVYVYSNRDGEYKLNIGSYNATVDVVDSFGYKNIGKLNAGDYIAIVTFDGDKNFNESTDLINFTVEKADPIFMIDLNGSEFDYGEYITVTHALPEDATGTISYYLSSGTNLDEITVYSDYILPVLDVGEYTVVAIYNGDVNYESSLDYTDFTVNRAANNAAVSVSDVTYGEESVIEVTADVDGVYQVDVNGTVYDIAVKNSIGSKSISLDAGIYYANVSFANDNYNTKSKNTEFEVKKAINDVTIIVDDVTYGDESVIVVAANVDGKYSVDIDGSVIEVDVEDGLGSGSIKLDAGSYSTKTAFVNDNYETTVTEADFKVNKMDNNITILANDIVYGTSSIINVLSLIDGIYEMHINDTAVNVTVTNGVGSYDAGILDVGTYDVSINYAGNSNVNPCNATATFTIFEAENNVVVTVEDVTYGEETVIELSADVDGVYQVDVNGTVYDVTVTNGAGNKTIALNAGTYYANATFNNRDYKTIAKNAIFNVNKADIELIIVVFDVVYPREVGGIAFASVDGEYDVTIGNYSTVVAVKDNLAYFNAGILDVGTYEAVLSFEGNDNYNSAMDKSTFDVKANGTVFDIWADVYAVQYGETFTILHNLSDGATGTIRYYLNNGTFLGELDVGENLTLPVLDAGSYAVIANYSGDKNFNSALDSVIVTVNPAINNAVVKVDDVTYGEDSIIKVEADVDGEYLVDINGTIFTVSVNNGKGNISTGLDAGSYYANVTFDNKNYDTTSLNTNFTVNKADVDLIIVVFDVVYPQEVDGIVFASVDGEYNVTIGNYSAVVVVEDSLAYFNAGILDVGTYEAVLSFEGNDNYNSARNETTFDVNATGTAFEIWANVYVVQYGETFTILHNLSDGATGTIGYYLNNGTFLGELDVGENLTLPVLDAGSYVVIANYSGDKNFNSAMDSVMVTVTPAINNAVVKVDDVTYGEDSIIKVEADVDGEYMVDVNGTVYAVEVTNGVGNRSVRLNAGKYCANVTFDNKNYNTPASNATFAVNKADVDLIIVVFDVVYPHEVGGAVFAGVDGEYNVTIGSYSTVVVVEDNFVKFNAGVFDVGTYDAVVSFAGNENYNSAMNETRFDVTARGTVFKIAVNASEISYGETATVTHVLSNRATGTIKYYLNNGTFLGELPVSDNLTLPILDAGYYAVIANYSGDKNFNSALDFVTIQVNKLSNSISVTAENVTYGDKSIIGIAVKFDGDYVVSVNDVSSNVTIVGGNYDFDAGILPTGDYGVEIIYAGDKNIEPCNATASFTVSKGVSEVSVDVKVNGTGAEVSVDVNPDATGNVTLLVNGEIVDEVPLEDGKASFRLDSIPADEYAVEVVYSGDDNYKPGKANATFVIEKLDAKLITPSRVIYVSDAVAGYVYQIILRDVNGNPLSGKEVLFRFNNRTYSAVTGDDGWANVTVTANEEGSYDVDVTFKGDGNYNSVSQLGSIKLVKESTKFLAPNRVVYVMDMAKGYTYQAILKSKDGKPLANKKVLITVNGKKQVAYTDENGYVTVKLTVNREGTYRVDLKFAGDRYCNAVSDYRTIKVIKQPATVAASPVTYSVDAKAKKVTATLKSSYGNAVSSGKITLKVNGVQYTAYTNAKGVATFSIDIAKKGVFYAIVTFEGSDYYKKSSNSTKITIN